MIQNLLQELLKIQYYVNFQYLIFHQLVANDNEYQPISFSYKIDFYRNLSTKEEQIENFLFHLEYSKLLDKPIIIHCRDSFQDTYDQLVEFNNPSSIILHSWTGGRKWTKRFVELGVYFSISGIVTYDTAKDLQLSVKEIPIDKLLLETDTPYLAPVPLRGQDNRPNFIEHTAMKLSLIHI